MAKNIIFCADGTWNGPGQDHDHDRVADPTNVFKLFANLEGSDSSETLRLADEQERVLTIEGQLSQTAKYLHGVGDSSNFLVKLLGGAGGAGLITRIVRGYTFVSRNYEDGDRIFLVGFSRGAYTARALAGLINARGLLDATKIDLTDKDAAYRLGAAEWFEYRRNALRSRPSSFAQLQEFALDLPHFVSAPPKASRIAAPIEAIAVWDTVGALGIPDYNLEGMRLDAFQFADTALSPNVRHGLHAISVDERRADFTPTFWDPAPSVTQVLFPGAHADVGGGYPAADKGSGLSDGALRWMTEELDRLGVRVADAPLFALAPDPCGVGHEPWLSPPWPLLPRAPRTFRSGLSLHESILLRIARSPVPTESSPSCLYAPAGLTSYIANGAALAGVVVIGVANPK